MKKTIIYVCVLLLCLSAAVCAYAALPGVIDNSGLLTADEAQKLEDLVDAASDRWDIDIVILTADSLDGKSAMAYADDYYDDNGYGDDGVLLLVSMTEREWWISTSGRCIWAIDSDQLGSQFVQHLSIGHYYDAFTAFLDGCETAMKAEGDAGYEPRPQESDPMIPILVCLGIGAVVGLIVVLVMKGQLKSVRTQPGAGSYIRAGSMHLTQQSDRFLYQNVTRRAKPKDNHHSGGGGFHVSSSGRSHGGGGGRF